MRRYLWQYLPFRAVCVLDVFCIAGIVAILTIPAVAATAIPIPFTSYVIDLGDMPPWIMAFVVSATWYEARTARKIAASADAKLMAVGTKIDGMLVTRDEAKFADGERKGQQAGADAAEQLAEGQRRGIEIERASVATKNVTPAVDPVATEEKK